MDFMNYFWVKYLSRHLNGDAAAESTLLHSKSLSICFLFFSSMLNFTLKIKLYSMYALTGPLGLYRESEWTDKRGSPGLEHDWIYAGIFTGSH